MSQVWPEDGERRENLEQRVQLLEVDLDNALAEAETLREAIAELVEAGDGLIKSSSYSTDVVMEARYKWYAAKFRALCEY